MFHLTHGFYEFSVKVPAGGQTFEHRSGRSTFINPRRYGAATVSDHERYRLSIFTREEAGAILAYLEYKREQADMDIDKERLDAALSSFWRERAHTAPTAEDLRRHSADDEAFLAALLKSQDAK